MTEQPEAIHGGRTDRGPQVKSPPTTSERIRHSDILTVTIKARTGQIIKVEGSDSGGVRHRLTEQERADLAKETSEDTFEELIEKAFEAGIACVLGDANGQIDGEESEEETDLRHFLLGDLIRNSPARRLMEREALTRAILGSVIRYAIDRESPHQEKRPAQQRPSAPVGKSHRGIRRTGRGHTGTT